MVLSELFETVSPTLAANYQRIVNRWTGQHVPGLPDMADAYARYAIADERMPRPLLTLVGYACDRDTITADLADEAGEVCFLAQVVRDFLAIHDDVVDGDTVKFGQPTLPAALAAAAPPGPELVRARYGENAAIYLGDLLWGLCGDLIESSGALPEIRCALHALVSRTLRRTQRGQLTELTLQHRPPSGVTIEELHAMYADKAAEYCYVMPFEVGAIVADRAPTLRQAARPVLEAVGVASQIVDDIAGACPGLLDEEKDTPGEIAQLRRTVLLVELARALPAGHRLGEVISRQRVADEDLAEIRQGFVRFGAVDRAVAQAQRLAAAAELAIDQAGLGAAAAEYLRELVAVRVRASLAKIAA